MKELTMNRIKKLASQIVGLVYPPTKAKLHRIVTWIGVTFAAFAVVMTWIGELGLSTTGKIGATLGMLATLAAGWERVKPELLKGIDGLPIPDDDSPSKKGTACVLALMLAAMTLLWSGRSLAADSQFGGCFAGGQLCAGPSATITVGEFNLTTQKFSGGVSPGIGYGMTYAPDAWYATGLSAYLAFTVGGGQPNSARPALMFSFANYVRLGMGMAITERDVGILQQWSLLFGLGSDFGGSPTYTGSRP
jgi:hypothetical protein